MYPNRYPNGPTRKTIPPDTWGQTKVKDKSINRKGIGVIGFLYSLIGVAKILAIAGLIPHILLPFI